MNLLSPAKLRRELVYCGREILSRSVVERILGAARNLQL